MCSAQHPQDFFLTASVVSAAVDVDGVLVNSTGTSGAAFCVGCAPYFSTLNGNCHRIVNCRGSLDMYSMNYNRCNSS